MFARAFVWLFGARRSGRHLVVQFGIDLVLTKGVRKLASVRNEVPLESLCDFDDVLMEISMELWESGHSVTAMSVIALTWFPRGKAPHLTAQVSP